MLSGWVRLFPNLQILKLKFPDLSYELDSFLALALEFVLVFSSLVMVDVTSLFVSTPPTEWFLDIVKSTRPPPIRVDNQAAFLDLVCIWMTFYEFIYLPGICKRQGCLFLFLILFLASSSEGFVVWFEIFLLSKEDNLCLELDWFSFLLGCVTPLFSWNISLVISSLSQKYRSLSKHLVNKSNTCTHNFF